MGLALLQRLDASAVDLSFKRYHNQSTPAVFKGGTVTEKNKDGKDSITVVLEWEIESAIEDMDGNKLNPGSTLKQSLWIPQDGSDMQAWRMKDLALVAIALGHPRPVTGAPAPMPDDSDIGKKVNLLLTYKPDKEDPNDRSKGNQNFRVSAVKP